MSYDTDRNWFYELYGRKVHLWQWVETAASDTVANYRVKLPSEFYGSQLIYPNEDITNGLRVEYTALYEPFISESLEDTTKRASGTDISFSTTTITGAGTSDGFATGDKVRIIGSASNDGVYTSISSGSNTLVFASSTFTAESAGESITVYQIPKPVADSSVDETSHMNLNRLLSLAVIDYIKAQVALEQGDINMKEYFMRDFYKKIADDQSNRRKISITFPVSNFAVR
tara:strand:+ start:1637 stop:2323 length:687 start_codon:yes stop_codon:yes gene_type:complete